MILMLSRIFTTVGRPHLRATFLAALFGALPLISACAAGLTLVDQHRARAVIVVAPGGLPPGHAVTRGREVRARAASLAAAELADYLKKSTGAEIPVVEEQAPIDATRFPVRIYLGACAENQRLVGARPLAPEEFIIRTSPDALHIIGGDRADGIGDVAGTLDAVYTFLEDYVGVRWLFPGELGEVVPQHASFTLPAIERRQQPPVPKRRIRDVAISREEGFAPILKAWAVSVDEWKQAFSPAVDGPWFRRQRLGARIEINGGHSYGGFYEKYGAEHPDFFALQPDGTRRQTPVRERLCVSNPDLPEFVARLRIEALKADPSLKTISIAPNDGGGNKFCMCERCRSWDPPNAPKINDALLPYLIDPTTGKHFTAYPSLSDRYFRFFNEVARRVGAEVPDRSVVTYAYSFYRTPPVTIQKLEPNLIVCFVGLKLEDIEAWSRLAAKLAIRPNDLGPMVDLGLPRNSAAYFVHAVKFAVDHHAISFDFDNCHGNWGGHGLDYYMLAHALWNPDLDVAAMTADYCEASYGRGAAAMVRYFRELETVTDAVRADSRLATDPTGLLRYYTPAVLANLKATVGEAKSAVGASDPACTARLAMVEDSLHYARLVTSLLEATRGTPRNSKLQQERMAETMEFLRQKVLTPSIASLHSLRYLRKALSNAQREDQ